MSLVDAGAEMACSTQHLFLNRAGINFTMIHDKCGVQGNFSIHLDLRGYCINLPSCKLPLFLQLYGQTHFVMPFFC